MCKCNCKIGKALLKVLLRLLAVVLGFFVVTFTIYIFNLDMKATAFLAPWLEKWYDHLEHKQYICSNNRIKSEREPDGLPQTFCPGRRGSAYPAVRTARGAAKIIKKIVGSGKKPLILSKNWSKIRRYKKPFCFHFFRSAARRTDRRREGYPFADGAARRGDTPRFFLRRAGGGKNGIIPV